MLKFSKYYKRILVLMMIVILLPIYAYADSIPKGNEITKAEFIAEISDYFGWPHPSDYNDIWKTPLKQFNDVDTTDEYGKQIEAAYEEGIIGGDDSGRFYPESGISREDAAIIFVNAFKIPYLDTETVFLDKDEIGPEARASVNTLVNRGFMSGRTDYLFMPNALIKKEEVARIFDKITSTMVSPVYALPRQNYSAPRRYVKLYCATPGATIYFTKDGTEPDTSSQVYDVSTVGHINEMLSNSQLPERDVVYKAIAVKDGMVASPVQTFTWHLSRPVIDDFQYECILEKTPTSPAVYEIYNDSESVRAMAWYIEGQDSGIVFDALQTPSNVKNLKEFIDDNIATTPYSLIIGHEHPDHNAQIENFVNAEVDVYSNNRGWSSIRRLIPDPAKQAMVKNIDESDLFHLGGCDLHVYAIPGHANDNIVLQDKENGLIFSSDIYGCTRAGSADNVNVSGVRVDLLLSIAQQTYSNYLKDGGKIEKLFTGHDETPLGDINLQLFEAALQQVVDKGEEGCSPTLRGNNDAPNSRTTIIGDMWKDGTNWIALKLAGIMGDSTEYLTNNATANYNGTDGFMKYSVLSNIEIEGGELVGKTLQWQPASAPFDWAGSTISVSNSLPNKFDPWYFEYTIQVPESNENITIIPTTMSTMVKSIRLNGKKIEYRSSNNIPVSDGTIITIEIVAPDKVTKSTYTFTVEKN